MEQDTVWTIVMASKSRVQGNSFIVIANGVIFSRVHIIKHVKSIANVESSKMSRNEVVLDTWCIRTLKHGQMLRAILPELGP